MTETRMPAGPETILPPPSLPLPPEQFFKKPETIPEENPITELLKKKKMAWFVNEQHGLNPGGRKLAQETLDNLIRDNRRDWRAIGNTISQARNDASNREAEPFFRVLRAKFDYLVAVAAVNAISDRENGFDFKRRSAFDLDPEDVYQWAELCRPEIIGQEENEISGNSDFLERLKKTEEEILEKAEKQVKADIDYYLKVRSLLPEEKKFLGSAQIDPKVYTPVVKEGIRLLHQRQVPTPTARPIGVETRKKGESFFRLPLKLSRKTIRRAVAASAMILLLGAMGVQEKVNAVLARPVVEPQEKSDTYSKAQKLGSASAVKIPRQEIPRTISKEYYDAAMWAQKETGVPRSVILGIFRQESSMGKDPNLLASKDLGPAQIRASTWETVKERVGTMVKPEKPNPNNPRHAALAAALILKDSGFTKDAKRAIRTYHRGLGHWQDKLGKDYYDKVLGYAVSFEESLQQAGF